MIIGEVVMGIRFSVAAGCGMVEPVIITGASFGTFCFCAFAGEGPDPVSPAQAMPEQRTGPAKARQQSH